MYEYKVKEILSVYDGDTITVVLNLGFGVSKVEKLRFALINAPEMRGDEHDAGVISRDWLRNVLSEAMNSTGIIVKTNKDRKGKYGRYIAELFIDGVSINQRMLNEGLAVEY